ncbi:MAG: hypothetical protein DHS20C15_12560 [Planctomycetota bacterium]|nr:MAG: hypothetical protein DHS20C15_12560 [Planctomycetota bacterium]
MLLATLAVVRPGLDTLEFDTRTLDTARVLGAGEAARSAARNGASSAGEALPVFVGSSSPRPLAQTPRAFERSLDLSLQAGVSEFAALTPKLQKKVDKLDAKLLAKQAALVELEADHEAAEVAAATAVIALSFAESLLADAEVGLADALALPASTAQEIAARNLAVKAAKLELKAAKKGFKAAKKASKKAAKLLAKLGKKIDKNEAKQSSLASKLEQLDPGHFAQSSSGPQLAALSNAHQVVLTFSAIDDAQSYQLFWSTQAGVSPETGNLIDDVSSPHVVNGLPEGFTFHAIVAAVVGGELGAPSNPIEVTTTSEGDSDGQVDPGDDEPGDGEPGDGGSSGGSGEPAASPYDPAWADIAPLNTITLNYDAGASSTANGTALKNAVGSLQAGDMLVVGAGTWSIPSKFSPVFHGTAQAPVWVVAAEGAKPILTRPDASQNVMNPAGDYGVWRGFEITGGSAGMRIGAASNLWIDDNEIHDTPENAITANTADTDHLYITRNHIHHISVGTNGTGEGMYLGANNSAHVMSESVIALNHVHDTEGSQGDGIEVKQGSWGNWIVENDVHDTRFPAIIAYGTDGNAVNLIERNRLRGDTNQVLQVQGEAIVRNNLIMGGSTGFQSHDHQGNTRDLVFVHNTIVTKDKGAHLADWGGRAGMVFANNVVYSEDNQSVTFGSGSSGVAWAGNVLRGSTSGAPGGGAITGGGLSDFVDMAWDGSDQDATPVAGSPILGAGSATHAVSEDFSGEARSGALESGAIDVD